MVGAAVCIKVGKELGAGRAADAAWMCKVSCQHKCMRDPSIRRKEPRAREAWVGGRDRPGYSQYHYSYQLRKGQE